MIEVSRSAGEAGGLFSLQQVHIMSVRLDSVQKVQKSGLQAFQAVPGQCRVSCVLTQDIPVSRP